jgi:hypothetical protein
VKVYGESDGKEQFVKFDGATSTVYFDESSLGTKVSRTTLQCTIDKQLQVLVKSVSLIKSDGTLEPTMPSVFWGCDIELLVN